VASCVSQRALIQASCFAALVALNAETQPAETMLRFVSQPGSRVLIDGGNNVHEWRIKGEVIDGTVECGRGFPVAINQRVKLGDVDGHIDGSIPVRSLHHDSSAMDRIVYQALKEERNPRIYFRFDDLTLTKLPTRNGVAFLLDADSELTVAGVTNRSRIPISVQPLGNRQLMVTGAMNLPMNDFGIKPPEVDGEGFTIKTREVVRVRFGWLVGPERTPTAKATKVVPPFMAQGTISTSNRFSTTAAKFSFFSSNGWWQVDLTNFTMPPQYRSQNCMSIPGGVRHYTIFKGVTSWPSASACPIDFPPPGIAGGMLDGWLSLCPNPKLPTIDETRMHRFVMVPSAPFEVFNDPANQGYYTATYLEPGGAFLSALTITNDGVRIVWNPEGNELSRYPTPFENGFTEFRYQVVQATNLQAISFPMRGIMQLLGPNPDNRTQLAVMMHNEIRISRISLNPADLARQVHPAHLDGLDYRPAHLRGSECVSLIVTNDHWAAPLP
jgi:hypothetical protein